MTRRIDHLVLAVHDLAAAAHFYEQLGFLVGARNRHPWGTENHIIQFRSSFLELIGVADDDLIPPHAPGRFSFGAFVRDYLARRQGLAMLVLDGQDADADAAAFAAAGIGDFEPFTFERSGTAADGTPTRVAFSLAFARDERLPQAGFFTCRQHYPEAFWNPALQQHPNGAQNVTAVTLSTPHPDRFDRFFTNFTGVTPSEGTATFPLDRSGEIRMSAAGPAGLLSSYAVSGVDPHDLVDRARAQGLPVASDDDGALIEAADAYGVAIRFASATR